MAGYDAFGAEGAMPPYCDDLRLIVRSCLTTTPWDSVGLTYELGAMNSLRKRLVETVLAWEKAFGNAPSITSALSELDAAQLIGCSLEEYSAAMQGMTSVQKGFDFKFNGTRYQVKGNRPSGKPGSFVTWVPKATNYEWDYLIWVLYNSRYEIQEAWLWEVSEYQSAFNSVKRLSPAHYRQGKKLA